MPWKSRAAIFVALLLVLLVLLPYGQTFSYDFVNFDDHEYVFKNAEIVQGLTWANVGWAFTTFTAGNWHPLTWLSHMADVQLWGLNAGGHHLTSVLWHGADTALLFVILLQMTGGLWRSAFTAALFAVHPLHVESVAWVAERKDVLSTFFGLLAWWAYLGYARSGSGKKYCLVLVFFVLSLMAKQMWVTFPFLLLLLDLWPLRRWRLWAMEPEALAPGQPWRRIILEKIPLFALSAIFCGVTLLAQKTTIRTLDDFPLGARLGNAIVAYTAYLVKLFAPLKLAFFYPHPLHWPLSTVILSGFILLLITVAAVVYRRRSPWLMVGWLWFLGTLVPVIGLVQVGSQTIADRYTYLPSVGVFIMIVWSLPARHSRAWATVGVVVIALFTAKTWRQASYWRDSHTLFTHAAQVTKGNYVANFNLGGVLELEGDTVGALRLYRLAAAERPQYARVNIHENIADLLIQQHRYTEAMAELKAALELNPKSSVAYNAIGSLNLISNDNDQAAIHLRRALELNPKNKGAQINYGMALVNLGRWNEAIEQLSPVVQAEPERLLARTKLALAFAGRGEVDRATGELRQILQRDPDFAPARDALQKIEAKKEQPTPPPAT